MSTDALLSTLVTLLVTVDPVGLAPIFLSVTEGMTKHERCIVALRATLIALLVLTFFVLGGQSLLHWLGVGLPAFRIGGGLLLFWIAFEMVFERRTDRKQATVEVAVRQDHMRDVAAFPLAIPLMAGPGAITAVILLASRSDGNVMAVLLLLLLLCAVMLACLCVFMASERISGLLGRTGSIVLTRLLGVLLTALAVQFVVDGIRELLVAPS
jgi:multiple antibiotic resistance protein